MRNWVGNVFGWWTRLHVYFVTIRTQSSWWPKSIYIVESPSSILVRSIYSKVIWKRSSFHTAQLMVKVEISLLWRVLRFGCYNSVRIEERFWIERQRPQRGWKCKEGEVEMMMHILKQNIMWPNNFLSTLHWLSTLPFLLTLSFKPMHISLVEDIFNLPLWY